MLHAVDGLVEVAKKAVDVTKLPVSSCCRLRIVIVSENLLFQYLQYLEYLISRSTVFVLRSPTYTGLAEVGSDDQSLLKADLGREVKYCEQRIS